VSVVLQVSDTHFGTERPEVVEALVDLASQLKPDLIVLSGDLTQRARDSEFAAFRAFVARLLPAPCLAVPGNHDIPLFDLVTRLTRPFGAYAASCGQVLEPSCSLPDLFITGVNSVRPWRHKQGCLGAVQVEAVAQRLRRAGPSVMRVVVVHHPVDVADGLDPRDIVLGAADAVSAWAGAGADLVMSGHVTCPCVARWPFVMAPERGGAGLRWRARRFPVVRGGDGPTRWNVLRIDRFQGAERRVLEQREFDLTRCAFRLGAIFELP
jgi:3',5'-cyclic AMP phosphodiesterase CpdA